MNILVLTWRDMWNPSAGGAEQYTYRHARHWTLKGHRVKFLTARYPNSLPDEQRDGLVFIRRAGPLTVRIAAYEWIKRHHSWPDVVVDEMHGIPFGAVVYTRIPVVASIYEVAGTIWDAMFPRPVAAIGRMGEYCALRWYARAKVPIITISSSTALDLRALGVPTRCIHVIPPGINCAPLKSPPPKLKVPTVVFLGRLVRMKRVEDALLALSNLSECMPNCRLVLMGSGPPSYVATLRKLAYQLGIGERVSFCGRVDEDTKLSVLRDAHVLIHPSIHEGWGINVIEANAMGTPAVAYASGGLRDSIQDGETGLLCATRQPAQLAQALHRLFEDSSLYTRLQWNCLRWSSEFSWDVTADRSIAVLEASAQRRA